MSMSQRLSKLHQELTVKGEDLSHLTLEELSAGKIAFGEKHQGSTYGTYVCKTDPEWIKFMVNRYETSIKPEQRRLMKFVELKLEHHDKNQIPIHVPKAKSSVASASSIRHPKSKSAPRQTVMVDETEIQDLPVIERRHMGRHVTYRDVQPGGYAHGRSEPTACRGVRCRRGCSTWRMLWAV